MFSWQKQQLEYLNGMLKADRFPHALLLTGAGGTGKGEFAVEYAKKLLCEKNLEMACGSCHSCGVFEAETHPDFQYVAPAEEGKQISVDTIRDLITKLSTTSQFGRKTVAIIENAEQLNRNSANALLKTLEEPTPDTVLVLVTSFPHRLLPTIRSRCLKLDFPVPATETSLEFLSDQGVNESDLHLRLAHGSPLKALALAQSELSEQRKTVLKNMIKTARGQAISLAMKEIDKIPLKPVLDWCIDFCDDLIKVKLLGQPALITHADLNEVLGNMAPHCDHRALYRFRDELIERKKQSNIALNPQLLLEDLLILWQLAFKAR